MNPTDLLGRPLAEGDYIAWPTSAGRAIGMSVGVIQKINFKKPKIDYRYDGTPYKSSYERENCAADEATSYTITAKPLQAAYKGHYSEKLRYDPSAPVGKRFTATGEGAKAVSIQKVQNVVKVDAEHIDSAY